MKKVELVEAVATATGLTKADATRAIDATFEAITGALKDGDKVPLVGFGTFAVSERAAREGRNPRTGETVKIAARKAVTFKAGTALKVTSFLAAILTVSPVLVLRPSRAALSETAKVPNPTSGTLSPFTNASVIAAKVASIALVESALVNPVAVATASTNSTFFILFTSLCKLSIFCLQFKITIFQN